MTPVALWDESFNSQAVSIPVVRQGIRKALLDAGFADDLVDIALLLGSELATNALRHGSESDQSDFEVRLVPDPVGLYLEVADSNQTMPQPRRVHHDEEDGRGLLLLTQLGQKWGVTLTAGTGKVTWVLIRTILPEPLRSACQAARRGAPTCA